MIPFWCLMPKGEKLRPKQMDQLPLENFENSRVRILGLPKYSHCKIWSLVGRIYNYGKRGEFLDLVQFHFLMCWHKSPKRGRLIGECALGPFL
jgi:hypothetical protein